MHMATEVIATVPREIMRRAEHLQQAIAEMQAELNRLIGENFDPHEAGQQLVKEMQAAEGGSWTGSELKERFGLDPATLHTRRKGHRIVFWRDPKHDFHYPKWQFNPAGALLPGIQDVLQIFKSQDEWRVMRYFLAKRDQLDGRRPLDLLRDGDSNRVIQHANQHVEENTW